MSLKNKCARLNIFSGVRLKAFSFALLAILSLVTSSLSPVFSDVAKAASDYDDLITTTDNLEIDCFSSITGDPLGTSIDFSLGWSQVLNPENTVFEGNTINRYSVVGGSVGTRPQDQWNQLQENIDKARGWGVTKQDINTNGESFSVFIQTAEANLNFTGTGDDRALKFPNTYRIDVTCRQDGILVGYDNTTRNNTVKYAYSWDATTGIYFISNPINYPSGYEGEDVPETPNIPGSTQYPLLDYQVSKKSIKAQYKNNIPNMSHITWLLYKTEDDYVVPEGQDPINDVTKQISVNSNYAYEVNEYGNYLLVAGVECRTPFTCEPNGFDVGVTALQLNIDGSTFDGSSDNPECLNGICEPNNPYVDCTEFAGEAPYGFGGGSFPDIIGGIGCVWTNFGIFLRIMLIELFVPKDGFWGSYFSDLGDQMETKFGFVFTAFSYVGEWIGSILVAEADCTIDSDGTIFGQSIAFDLCTFEDIAPVGWAYGINIFRLFIGVVLVFAAYRRLFTILTGLGK